MKHKVNKLYLGLPRDQRMLLMGNLATSLVLNEKIKTTEAKARALQAIVDKLINSAKNENKRLALREVQKILQNEMSCRKMMEETVKRYKERSGGFTRITHLGFRAGDAAPLVQIELI